MENLAEKLTYITIWQWRNVLPNLIPAKLTSTNSEKQHSTGVAYHLTRFLSHNHWTKQPIQTTMVLSFLPHLYLNMVQ